MPMRKVEDGASIVVCSTCRFSQEARENEEGRRGGALLMEALQEAVPEAEVSVQPMPCLFACSRFCTVHLRAPGKVGYVMGGFAPDSAAAEAIAAFFASYRESEEGIVPFRAWPEGVKGHFIVRVPPAGFVTE